MIHRVVFGSIERFIGILTEQYAGAFPLWLAPVQVQILPISENTRTYAQKVYDKLIAAGLRCEIDNRNEKIGYKFREAQLQKIPYMLVIGDKEVQDGSVAVRNRKDGDIGSMDIDEFIAKAVAQIAENRRIDCIFFEGRMISSGLLFYSAHSKNIILAIVMSTRAT